MTQQQPISPLRRRMIEDMTVRNLSPSTQQSYAYAVANFSRHFGRSPDKLGLEEIRAFQLHLIGLKRSWTHINQVTCALRFFYAVTLGRKEAIERIISAREPIKQPVVLSAEEVARFLEAVPALRDRVALVTAYAAGDQDQHALAVERALSPAVVQGKERTCFAVAEPDAGLNTTQLRTQATRVGDQYVVNGKKVWISTAQVAEKILLLARTPPFDELAKPADGLSLFYTSLDRRRVAVREIDKMGRKAVDSNELFIEDFEIPLEDRIGEEGRGFEYILHGMNPERILIAAEAIGLGRLALERATRYAKERIVFKRPIGKNQAIQHPLARCWVALEAAWLMTMSAAWHYDQGLPSGAAANAAKYLADEAGFDACQTAVMTHGGYGYAKEFHVERYLREVMIPRIAPISPQLCLCFIAERVLGLPKSY